MAKHKNYLLNLYFTSFLTKAQNELLIEIDDNV